MAFSNKELDKIKKKNLGKVLYSIIKINDNFGVVINHHIGKCIGQIKSINSDGICTLYNPFSKEKSTLNIIELNKNIISSDYYLSKKFISNHR